MFVAENLWPERIVKEIFDVNIEFGNMAAPSARKGKDSTLHEIGAGEDCDCKVIEGERRKMGDQEGKHRWEQKFEEVKM
jgi:hypothetical protein